MPADESENRNTPSETELTAALNSTDPALRKQLFEGLYDQLKAIAANRLRASKQSLQTTELVHEAYLKLAGAQASSYKDDGHFCAVAARAMRQILVDRARLRDRAKRGGDRDRVPLSETNALIFDDEVDVLSIDEALTELARFDERLARVVELRCFGGLSVEEVAAVVEVSPRSVKSDWRTARAWLRTFLSPAGSESAGEESPQN